MKKLSGKSKLSSRSSKRSSSNWVNVLFMLTLLVALPFGIIYTLSTVYLIRGDRLLANSKVDEAIRAYEMSLSFNSNAAQTYFKLGQARQEQKLYSEALEAYEKAFLTNPNLKIDPSLSAQLNELGDALQKENKLPEAINAYQKAVNLEPFYSEAYYNLGQALSKQQRWDEAIKAYEKTIDIDSRFVEAYIELGNIYTEQKQWQDAQNIYQKALQLNPYNAKIYQQLGKTLKEQGQLQEAIDTYLQAITFAPNNGDLYNLMGEALYEQKNIIQAIAAYQQALQISSKNPQIYKNLCYAQLSQREFLVALKHCQQALKLDPTLVDVKFYTQEIERGLAIRNNPQLLQHSERIPNRQSEPLVTTKRSIVKILVHGRNYYSLGTGWVIKRDQDTILIVTNRHVVSNTKQKRDPKAQIAVEFYSNPLPGEIRKRQMAKLLHITSPNDELDLAVLKIKNVPADIKPMTLSSLPILPATPVRVIGNPSNGEDWSIVAGEVRQNSEQALILSMMLVSGHSGSPVLNSQNRVVGVVSQAGLFCPNSSASASLEMSLKLGCGLAVPEGQVQKQLQEWGIIKK